MLIYRNIYAKLLIGILALGINSNSQARSENVHYTYQTVSISQHLTQNLYFQGTITPFNTYSVIAPFDGIITKQLGFYYGELLTKGQYLFTIQPTGNSDNYRTALIAYLNAKRSYNIAVQKFAGEQLMYNDGLIAKNDFTDFQTDMLNQKITLDEALLSLQKVIKLVTPNARAQQNLLDSLESLNLSDPKVQTALTQGFSNVAIMSPANGLALSPPTNNSDNIGTPQALGIMGINSTVKNGQVVVIVGNLKGLKIDINVEEINIDKLVKGQTVTITGPAFQQFTLQGIVNDISYQQSSNQYGGTPTYPATIVIPEITVAEQAVIHAGMTANVAIALPQPDAILIPINAIIIDGSNNFVMKKVGDTLQKTPVTIGSTTLDQIAILSGLQNGDIIAIPN